MKQHILVTGSAGYLGSILCEHPLDTGYSVTALDTLIYGEHNLNHFCDNPDFDFIRGDAREESVLKPLVKATDAIIPLAAIVGAQACDLDPYFATYLYRDAFSLFCKTWN